jgi:hypothetical protein
MHKAADRCPFQSLAKSRAAVGVEIWNIEQDDYEMAYL